MVDTSPLSDNNITLRSLTARYFRGFNSEITLPLNASAVIVAGANGRGKTSLFDALQWLCLGRIPRLEDLRFKRTEEHIVNRYAPVGERALVSVELSGIGNGAPVVATRIGDRQRTVLEVNIGDQSLVGEDAEQWLRDRIMSAEGSARIREGVTEKEFQRSFLTAALLEQDMVRAFLSSRSASERYEILSQLLGVAILGDFVDALEGTATRLREILNQRKHDLDTAEAAVTNTRGETEEAMARIAATPSIQQSEAEFESARVRAGISLNPPARDQAHAEYYEMIIGRAQRWLASLASIEAVHTTLRDHVERKPLQPMSVLETERQVATETETSLAGLLEQAIETHSSAETAWVTAQHQAEASQSLASAALPLLSDYCPVCTQAIEEPTVRLRLEQVLATNPELSVAAESSHTAREEVDSLRGRLAAARQELQTLEDQIASGVRWSSRISSLLGEATSAANILEPFAMPSLTIGTDDSGMALSDIEPWLSETRTSIVGLISAATAALAAHRAILDQARLRNLNVALQLRVTESETALTSVRSAESVLQARQELVEQAKLQSTHVMDDMFRELAPLVQDVFARLAPHPTFDELSFTHEVFRRQGSSVPVALDRLTGTEINPSLVFSSAQANVAALCYFIALAFASSESDFGFVLMDDPLQSMDDVNALGLSDLCRFLRRKKQVIISSHEARLTNLLRRKLAPRNEPLRTIVIDFVSWNRSGPSIDVHTDTSILEVQVLPSLN